MEYFYQVHEMLMDIKIVSTRVADMEYMLKYQTSISINVLKNVFKYVD